MQADEKQTAERGKKREEEEKAIASIVNRPGKKSREDYADILKKIDAGGFSPEVAKPYKAKIREHLRRLDEAAIDALFADLPTMSFEESMDLYRNLEEGDFLPEIKSNALAQLERKLSAIKADECELLQQKMKADLAMADMTEDEGFYFYPIRRVLAGETTPEETEIVDNALEAYASGREPFEYPIVVVDTSHDESGTEGMLLTPDHIFYSTKRHAYSLDVDQIREVSSSSGFWNSKLYVHFQNGTKTKIPYAIDAEELPNWAEVLDGFIHYLQDKPDSRDVEYLANDEHDTICCFRCGCHYSGGTVCPRCGYKNNAKEQA
jgi:hypothetical protein